MWRNFIIIYVDLHINCSYRLHKCGMEQVLYNVAQTVEKQLDNELERWVLHQHHPSYICHTAAPGPSV